MIRERKQSLRISEWALPKKGTPGLQTQTVIWRLEVRKGEPDGINCMSLSLMMVLMGSLQPLSFLHPRAENSPGILPPGKNQRMPVKRLKKWEEFHSNICASTSQKSYHRSGMCSPLSLASQRAEVGTPPTNPKTWRSNSYSMYTICRQPFYLEVRPRGK